MQPFYYQGTRTVDRIVADSEKHRVSGRRAVPEAATSSSSSFLGIDSQLNNGFLSIAPIYTLVAPKIALNKNIFFSSNLYDVTIVPPCDTDLPALISNKSESALSLSLFATASYEARGAHKSRRRQRRHTPTLRCLHTKADRALAEETGYAVLSLARS